MEEIIICSPKADENVSVPKQNRRDKLLKLKESQSVCNEENESDDDYCWFGEDPSDNMETESDFVLTEEDRKVLEYLEETFAKSARPLEQININLHQMGHFLQNEFVIKDPTLRESENTKKSTIETQFHHSENLENGEYGLFYDPIYGGFGPNYDESRYKEQKYCTWTLYQKKKISMNTYFRNLAGEVIRFKKIHVLDEVHDLDDNYTTDRKIELPVNTPKDILSIVHDFEDMETNEPNNICAPIQLEVLKPTKCYIKKEIIFPEIMSQDDISFLDFDQDDLPRFDYSYYNNNDHIDLSELNDSIIFSELEELSQSFQKQSNSSTSKLSLDVSQDSCPDNHLINPQEFCHFDQSTEDITLTPKSEKSIHLSDFDSQEIFNDEELLQVEIKTSPSTSHCSNLKPKTSNQAVQTDSEEQSIKMEDEELTICAKPLCTTGFNLANGKQCNVITSGRAKSLFSEIFDEFKCNPIGEIQNEEDITLKFMSKGLKQSKSDSFQFNKSKEIPVELQSTSFDAELCSNLELIESKFMVDNHIEPKIKEVTASKSMPISKSHHHMQNTTTKPVHVDTPEISFMSGLKIHQSSTPITTFKKSSHFFPSDIIPKRTNLINRMCDEEEDEFMQYGEEKIMSQEMKEIRNESFQEQLQLIQLKSKTKTSALGDLYIRKHEKNRLNWRNFIEQELLQKEITYQTVSLAKDVMNPNMPQITLMNAIDFRFNILQFFSVQELKSNKLMCKISPEAVIIPDENFFAGIEEFYNCLRSHPNIDCSQITFEWFQNHFKIIIFKLYLYSLRAKVPSGVFLNPSNVIDQLEYRYDCEIVKKYRSALRQIIDFGMDPTKRVILKIVDSIDEAGCITLSDGWYLIKAEIDDYIREKISIGVIKLGTNIVTANAELKLSDNIITSFYLTGNHCLKIHSNSTRLAPSNLKLGLQQNHSPLIINLNDVNIVGGKIASVLVHVTRIYPLMYFDKQNNKYISEQQAKKATCNNEICICESDVQEEYPHIKKPRLALDEATSEAIDSHDNVAKDECFNCVRTTKHLMVPYLRMRVLDAQHPKSDMLITYQCPKENYLNELKECTTYKVNDLTPNIKQGNTLHLLSTMKTEFKCLDSNLSEHAQFQRKFTLIEDVPKFVDKGPLFNEVDIVGMCVCIQQKNNSQLVYISNSKADLVIIQFYSAITETGYLETVKEGNILIFKNLEWRPIGSKTKPVSTLFVSPLSTKISSSQSEISFNEENQEIIDSFKTIDATEFCERLSLKYQNVKLDLEKFKDGFLKNTVSIGKNEMIEQEHETRNKRKRLGTSLSKTSSNTNVKKIRK